MPRKVKCSICNTICFSRSKTPKCINCARQPRKDIKLYQRGWNLKKKYGITNEEFDLLWITFKGRCAICNNILEMPSSGKGQNLKSVCVDHDHKTGNIRGLLCSGCNKGLGLFKDDPLILVKAKEYVE